MKAYNAHRSPRQFSTEAAKTPKRCRAARRKATRSARNEGKAETRQWAE